MANQKKCPRCNQVCNSRNVENGVYQFYCDRDKLSFEGNEIVDPIGFAQDERYNEY